MQDLGTYRSRSRCPLNLASQFYGIGSWDATCLMACINLLCYEGFGGCHENYFAFREPTIICWKGPFEMLFSSNYKCHDFTIQHDDASDKGFSEACR